MSEPTNATKYAVSRRARENLEKQGQRLVNEVNAGKFCLLIILHLQCSMFGREVARETEHDQVQVPRSSVFCPMDRCIYCQVVR